jgi:hypothetical protein
MCLRVPLHGVRACSCHLSCSFQDPSDPTTSMFGPEMQATPWTPDVSSQVVSGPHQESGTALPVRRPSSESPPPYGDMPAVPTQSQTPTPDQSRSPRLRRK